MPNIHPSFTPQKKQEYYDRMMNRHPDDPPDSEIETAWIDYAKRAGIHFLEYRYMNERWAYYRWYKRQARDKAKVGDWYERNIDIPPQMQHLFD